MSYRVIPPKHAVEVVVSLEQGLLLPANPLCRFIIESCLARAQALHPVTICHYLVEGSHIHFFIYVEEPDTLVHFIERFKTESAHYINSMLGRKKRTVWCKSYSCTPVLTLSRAIEKIVYIYTNPAKDSLETSIENYPGLSSWAQFKSKKYRKCIKRLHRPMIPYLPERFYSKYQYKRRMRDLKDNASSSHQLTLQPDAWMKYFDITNSKEAKKLNEQIVEFIKAKELEFEKIRKDEGKSVIGARALKAAHLDPDYMPHRTGKKMWCLCDDKDLRISYIKWAKEIKNKARVVYEHWKNGDFSVSFPPGVFPPAIPKLSNMTTLACDY